MSAPGLALQVRGGRLLGAAGAATGQQAACRPGAHLHCDRRLGLHLGPLLLNCLLNGLLLQGGQPAAKHAQAGAARAPSQQNAAACLLR